MKPKESEKRLTLHITIVKYITSIKNACNVFRDVNLISNIATLLFVMPVVLSISCSEDSIHHDLPTPIGISVSSIFQGSLHTNTLSWDSTGPFQTQAWRSLDGRVFDRVLDTTITFNFVDSGGAEIDSALYIIRFVLPGDHHSAFADPVCFYCKPIPGPDPNAGVLTSDGTTLVCH